MNDDKLFNELFQGDLAMTQRAELLRRGALFFLTGL
jgi:hypothetical protein